MFLLRLIYLESLKPKNESRSNNDVINVKKNDIQEQTSSQIINKETINQIKNVSQEKKIKPEPNIRSKASNKDDIKSFNELVELCYHKKEMKLKYELEKNVNLVKFEKGRIEISFNDNLDKDFVKNLSSKLSEWTNQRWIISFSKNQGEMSIKDKEKNNLQELIEKTKKSNLYKNVLKYFPDAEIIDVKPLHKDDD